MSKEQSVGGMGGGKQVVAGEEKLSDFLNEENIFAVFFKAGGHRIVVSTAERQLPVRMEEVELAFNIRECRELLASMEQVLGARIEITENGTAFVSRQ